MLALLAVVVVSFGAAFLTLFSGFGLGTLLLPVFALFLPVELAVAATAVVHLANNLFKVALVGRAADRAVVLAFGLPSMAAAFVGAWILAGLAGRAPLASYALGGLQAEVTVTKLVIGPLIVFFALFDLLPRLRHLAVERRWLPLGGVLSGFFGGLSGQQGALRAAFLVKSGLSRDAFIGTSVVVAVLVDFARLVVYGTSFYGAHFSTLGASDGQGIAMLMVAATAAAFAGSFLGARWVQKVTLEFVQRLVGVGILLLGVLLTVGWI